MYGGGGKCLSYCLCGAGLVAPFYSIFWKGVELIVPFSFAISTNPYDHKIAQLIAYLLFCLHRLMNSAYVRTDFYRILIDVFSVSNSLFRSSLSDD